MGDLSKLMTDERLRKIELFHYLVKHEHNTPAYNEILEILAQDAKEFIKEAEKELAEN